MDHRLLPASLALAGVAAAAWRRARRRAAPAGAPAVEPQPRPEPEVLLTAPAGESAESPDGEPAGVRFASLAWEPAEDPGDAAASVLRIRFELPATAVAPARIDVRETPSHVIVTVLAQCDPAQAAGGAPQEATVALQAPLGERALVHPPHDHPRGRSAG